MKPPVGGLSHKELHGSGSALNVGGPGERAHSMHSPAPAPSAESGGQTRAGSDRIRTLQTDAYRETAQAGDNTREGIARAENQKMYEHQDEGYDIANNVKDTDSVIASARGDAPGTEYAEGPSGAAEPIGSNMAGQRKP
jgi:hypothetical protein